MAERKLGRGRLTSDLRTKMDRRAARHAADIVLPHHELVFVTLSKADRYDIHIREGVPFDHIPRALYECTFCGGLWTYKSRHEAEGETCPSRS